MTDLIAKIEELHETIKGLQEEKKNLEDQWLLENKATIEAELSDKEYGCGTVTLETDQWEAKITVSKKVSYDQDTLKGLYNQTGDDRDEYVKLTYAIEESKFKAWPSAIQNFFSAARTVTPSKPSFVIKRK